MPCRQYQPSPGQNQYQPNRAGGLLAARLANTLERHIGTIVSRETANERFHMEIASELSDVSLPDPVARIETEVKGLALVVR